MDGKQEAAQSVEGEQRQTIQKPLSGTEIRQQPQPTQSPFAERLLEIRTASQANLQRLTIFFGGNTSGLAVQQEEARPAGAQLPLEELARRDDLEAGEYLQNSTRALAESANLRQQLIAGHETLSWSLYQRKMRDQRDLEKKISQVNQLRGIRKIPAFFERRDLAKQKAAMQQEIDSLNSQIESNQKLLTQIQQQEASVKRKQEDILLTEVTQIVQTIKGGYEQLLQETLEDGTVPSEIRNSYIQQVIAPRVEEIAKQSKLPKGKKEAFYNTLATYLNNSDNNGIIEGSEQWSALYNQVNNLGFYSVWADCQVLLRGGDKKIIKRLVARLAADDIAPLRNLVEPYYNDRWESRDKFSAGFNKAIEPTRSGWSYEWDKNSFGNHILEALSKSDSERHPDMRFWLAVKSSPTANQVFGEAIGLQDREYHQTALNESLSDDDGGYIDLLRFYPTPEAIRNLVILAAADYRNYRTVHANWSLSDLSKRSDWKALLDEAEKVYPSLKTARQVLEDWNWTEYTNCPNIQEAVNDFVLAVFDSESNDSQLAKLARGSLTNGAILTILAKRGTLSKERVDILKEADAYLKQISEESQKQHKEEDYSIPYINEYSFKNGLRGNLVVLLSLGGGSEQTMANIKRFEALSKAVVENKTNYPAVDYLTNDSVVRKVKDSTFDDVTLSVFLTAYQSCPDLLTSDDLLGEFCRQFDGEQSVEFFRDMSLAYQNQDYKLFPKISYLNEDYQLNQIIAQVGKGTLTRTRALELPAKGREILSSSTFPVALEFPQLFLGTDDGLEFFTKANTGSLFSLNRELDVNIGERIRALQREGALSFPELIHTIVPQEIEQIDKLLSSGSSVEVNQQNWQQLLMGYVRSQVAVHGLPALSQPSADKINALFNNPKVRDLCLNSLRDSWLAYLKSGKPAAVPFSLNLTSEFINYCGGAGPLSQIQSLNSLIGSVNKVFLRKTTTEKTKLEICQGLAAMEDRYARWSDKDKTDFYNISRDILEAAPSLFSDYLSLFEKLTPAQMKLFVKDIYPLYKTKLVLLEIKNQKGRDYDRGELIHIRKDIRDFVNVFNAGPESFEAQKQKLLGEIKGLFTERFGIIKIPEAFTPEHMRSFTNISTYLANLHGRNSAKETVLGFYLSLMLNDRWDEFRRGETIDPKEYLVPERSSLISNLLESRQRLNPLAPESLGISQEDMPEFLKLLQQETQNMVVGNIETIDVKLANIILNLQGLEDLDLYPDSLDKQRMQLLLNWGNKKVGSVVARMYQSLATPGKIFQFSEEDTKIQQQITQAIQRLGLSLTPQTLKEHFQDGIKPLATVVNLLHFIEDTQAEPEIEILRDLLKPSLEVIEIFKRLGEDFKPTSGAMALSQDLSYLDNLIVKREDEITPEEKNLLAQYIISIRTQVIKLESVYSQIKNKFGSLKQGDHTSSNPLLLDKLNQIDKIISTQTSLQAITSTATNNLNVIIENIRECLACTREGCNNDTDLTFGDMNKFYLYSQSETQQGGSISDQLVFVEPVIRADGSQETAFVLDRIYGTNTPTILENQIEAVLKKYRAIKQKFPGVKLSVLVSDAAISTGGTSSEMLLEKFRSKNISAEKERVEVNIAESATGDHYIEFAGGSRTAGKRQVSGIIISF